MFGGPYSTWLEIDLSAIKNNIRQIQAVTQRPVMAVIKANGYGHGLVECGRAAAAAGASWLGVARLDEAIRLRKAAVQLPILVLGFCSPEHVSEALFHHISLTVADPLAGAAYAAQAKALKATLPVHAKIDSGMGRLGVFAEHGLEFIRTLRDYPSLEVEGMFTHLARADEPDADTTTWQLERFSQLVRELEAAGLRPGLIHAANSAGALYFPHSRFDMVRPGIAIYGLRPSVAVPLPQGFRPAMSWKTQLISIKDFPAGHGVGYNYRYYTAGRERIGVIAVGYADGFRRCLGNFALVGGNRVNVVGGVCMDQCMVNLDEVPSAKTGDEVVLMGTQGDLAIYAEEIGQAWGTINYEVVCGLSDRVPRIYVD